MPYRDGEVMLIKSHVKHFQFPEFGGLEFTIEGLWDELTGGSWMDAEGNPACLVYAMRSAGAGVPIDNDVYYGHTPNGLGHLLHSSELEEILPLAA